MHDESQNVFVRTDPEHPRIDRYLDGDIEAPPEEVCNGRNDIRTRHLADGEVQRYLRRREHLLERAVRRVRVSGTQRFVAFDDVEHRRPERGEIEIAGQPHGERNVVHRRGRVELVEEPVPLLRRRERRPLRTWARHQCSPTARTDSALHVRDQRGDGRALEQRPHRHDGVQCRAESRDHLCGDQRVAAQGEEVVVESDSVDVQDVGEHSGDDLLDRRGRCAELTRLEHRCG